jgi:hypothetical protein
MHVPDVTVVYIRETCVFTWLWLRVLMFTFGKLVCSLLLIVMYAFVPTVQTHDGFKNSLGNKKIWRHWFRFWADYGWYLRPNSVEIGRFSEESTLPNFVDIRWYLFLFVTREWSSLINLSFSTKRCATALVELLKLSFHRPTISRLRSSYWPANVLDSRVIWELA